MTNENYIMNAHFVHDIRAKMSQGGAIDERRMLIMKAHYVHGIMRVSKLGKSSKLREKSGE